MSKIKKTSIYFFIYTVCLVFLFWNVKISDLSASQENILESDSFIISNDVGPTKIVIESQLYVEEGIEELDNLEVDVTDLDTIYYIG